MGLSHDPEARAICETSGKERLAKGQAKSLAKRMRGHYNLHAYRCPHCRGWHVGNWRR